MGSMITLRLGRLEVDWGKNNFFTNHSALFRETDLSEADCLREDGVVERKPAFVRRLGNVVPRLELLGYDLEGCRRTYDEAVRRIPDFYPAMSVTFDAFREALCRVDPDRIDVDAYEADCDPGEFARTILGDPAFGESLPSGLTDDDGLFFENLDAYVVLRLLAENPANLDRDLVWDIADVVDGGWVEDGHIFEPLDERKRLLIVTEGSSDSNVLRTALPLVSPDVADFFDFVDMRENYPFTGTGHLVNFCKGLAAIRVQNRIVVVLDNDTAGHVAMRKLMELRMPANIRLVGLPDLEDFRNFPTVGPSGRTNEDVNGRAVAIECFLDLTYGPREDPVVRWTGFDKAANAYQGELVSKDLYTRRFFDRAREDGYDLGKLRILWQHILRACTGAPTRLDVAA